MSFFQNVKILSDKYEVNFQIFNVIWSNMDFSNFDITKIQNYIYSNIIFIENLIIFSFVIAIISILETNISGKIAQDKTKLEFDKNKEIFWNAMVNIWSWFFWWLPATAVLVRTSINIDSGANSKYSQFISGIFILVICYFIFSDIFVYLPMPIVASILIFTAIRIMDFEIIIKYYKIKKESFVIILITIFTSIFFDNIIGIAIWTIASLLLFVRRVTKQKIQVTVFRKKEFFGKFFLSEYEKVSEKWDFILLKLRWELNYLNADNHIKYIKKITTNKSIVLCFDGLLDIDIDGINIVSDLISLSNKSEIDMYITWLSDSTRLIFSKINWFKEFENKWKIFDSNTEIIKQKLS